MDTSKQEEYLSNMSMPMEAPPSYNEIESVETAPFHASLPSPQVQLSPVSPTFKPIVIPQTSAPSLMVRGVFFSPFARAYSPALQQHALPPSAFLSFLDGLNEVFIPPPGFQIASHVGSLVSIVPLPVVGLVGSAISGATGLIADTAAWSRAKAYVKTANEEVFLPRGLRCKVLKTQNMMAAVGHGALELVLPPLEMDSQGSGNDDPRMRRVRALGDRVAPLTFDDLPAHVAHEEWWKRMGSKTAQKKDMRSYKKTMKKRYKGFEKYEEAMLDADEDALKYDRDIAKIEAEKRKDLAKAEEKMAGRKGQQPEKRAKIEAKLERKLRQSDQEMAKAVREKEARTMQNSRHGREISQKADKREHKIAQKIYWIVIDKAERLEQEVGVEDDVEDADSEKHV